MAKQYKLGAKRKAVNALVRSLARRGKGPASEMTIVGRSSGKRRSVMVTPVHLDDVTYIVAPYGAVNWVHNIRVNPRITLSRGGATTRFNATEIGESGRATCRERM